MLKTVVYLTSTPGPISGDSYSSIADGMQTPEPTTDLPLGAKWPGFTWNEPDLPNWVGHLLTKYAPGPKYDPTADQQDEAYLAAPLLAYDYAIGGATHLGVRHQVERFLRSDFSKKIDPKDSLFGRGIYMQLAILRVGLIDLFFITKSLLVWYQ